MRVPRGRCPSCGEVAPLAQITVVNTRIDSVEARLTNQIAAVNTRIDAVLLADREAART